MPEEASGEGEAGETSPGVRRSAGAAKVKSAARAGGAPASKSGMAMLKRGHAFSYAGVFLFTTLLYLRPYELIPALGFLSSSIAFYIAVLTILIFIPAQLGLEGTLTARPREVNLLLLFCLAALLSIPLAINRGEAWEEFVGFSKVVMMFIVMVNVVRTERRLKWLVLLILAASLILSMGAIQDYRAGRFNTGGERIAGIISGMFGNPNDLAMHLATMVPLTLALYLTTRGLHKKLIYVASAILMTVAVVLTFSRGGFLGLFAAAFVLAWKFGRRNRFVVALATLAVVGLFMVLAPGEYTERLTSIVDTARDIHGSASARQAILIRSIMVALANPLFGVGMGNFHTVSISEQVSHNAYTQVASEMGLPAMLIYILFLLAPLKRLRQVERATFAEKHGRDYYWSVGLQASIVAYMVSSFFGSVAYLWYIYYLVAFSFCFHRIYEAGRTTTDANSSATTKAADAQDEGQRAFHDAVSAR